MKNIRLDKYLADMGIGTRSEVKNLIKKKRILVNDNIIMSPESKIDPIIDIVSFDGRVINYVKNRYYMLNKPAGCVSATEDNTASTVLDYIDDVKKSELFPVGRLDKDTEGLLLITNDGELAHNLLSPTKHVDKEYYVLLDKPLDDSHRLSIENGVDIGDDKLTLPATVKYIDENDRKKVTITIHEGRFHQVKRMFKAFDYEVLYLKRIRMGALKLDKNLKEGEFRQLTDTELKLISRTPYKAYIFDLDGTLVDSMSIWHQIDIDFLKSHNLETPEDLQNDIEGLSFSETATYFKNRFNLAEDEETIKNTWNNMAYDMYTNTIPLKKYTYEFLSKAKESGLKLAIATSNSTPLTSAVLKALNIESFFDAVITSCDISKGKPAPDVYLAAAAKLDVDPSDCLVFEDIPNGIMAGKNAGMDVCAVWDAYSEKNTEEKKQLADFYIDSYEEWIL